MILTDSEIAIAIQTGQIRIKPDIAPDAFSSTSIDLTLAETGRVWRVGGGMPLRPGHRDYKYADAVALQDAVNLDA